jgi:hypothetical protein
MSSIDRSRQVDESLKHYAGVRMQQGRVLTDDDFNAAASLDAEELRRTRLHAIGAYGTPDAGFLPKDFAVVDGKLDFKLSNGHLYLGGMRLEMNSEDHLLRQKDWLNFDPSVPELSPPTEGNSRTDLVWIECWQQPVTAIEDSELFEVALAGADTSTRWRTMRRVQLEANVAASECAAAWSSVAAGFAALGSINPAMELASSASLKVSYTAPAVSGDLCSPAMAGGYLGAENQAIRVQLVDASHYTWGFDNAAPLYRVKLSVNKSGSLVQLTFLNQPKDAVHWPLKGQVVEILPWSAALPNGERLAELSGHLGKVSVSYDPDSQTLEIDTPIASSFGRQWKSRKDVDDFYNGKPDQDFFYLRVWNRGDDLSSPAAIPIANGRLGNTGLQVTFQGGPLRPADYWLIAARPAAPDVVVPWILSSAAGAPFNGIQRYRAPLALIHWTTSGGVTSGKLLHDCRPGFLPLTHQRGCCNLTVGDGTDSFGMYTSIQAAIDALPPSGGTVCILPGHYQEAVRIEACRNVTLHGCGPSSRLIAPELTDEKSTALLIRDSHNVLVESLAIEGGDRAVIEVASSATIRLASNLIQFRDAAKTASPWPALFIDGDEIEIEGNIIEPLPKELSRIFHKLASSLADELARAARGGIQLAGGCQHVRISGNVIVAGAGNGITLGSILRVDPNNPDGRPLPDIDTDLEDPCAPCEPINHGPPNSDDGNTAVRYESAGDLYAITIQDNLISRQGGNGIAVVRFFAPSSGMLAAGGLVLVAIHGLQIIQNSIVACLQRPIAQPASRFLLLLGYGGISLAFVTGLQIASNVIAGNGSNWLSPVCGIFLLASDGLRIEHNWIRCNGERNAEPVKSAQPGIRAGIHIWMALSLQSGSSGKPPTKPTFQAPARLDGGLRAGVEQLRVHANQVEQPLGRALFMLGAGPMQVTENRFVSEGCGAPATDSIASTVLVGNLGFSKEWTLGLLMLLPYLLYANSAKNKDTAKRLREQICTLSQLSVFMPGIWPRLPTGKLLFSNNQVSFLMPDASLGFDVSSVLLMSLDDIAANDNQLEWHAQQRLILANLLALGVSVRSNDNRLAETWGRSLRSVFSLALMNTAANNQSTHCITALGLNRAVHHNLALAQTFCAYACRDPRRLLTNLRVGAKAGFTQS